MAIDRGWSKEGRGKGADPTEHALDEFLLRFHSFRMQSRVKSRHGNFSSTDFEWETCNMLCLQQL